MIPGCDYLMMLPRTVSLSLSSFQLPTDHHSFVVSVLVSIIPLLLHNYPSGVRLFVLSYSLYKPSVS